MQEETIKLNLIKQIMEMHDTSKLKKVDSAIHKIVAEEEVLHALARPMRKKMNIEELKEEQNFKPINKKDFFEKIDELNVEESIDKLLEMI
ncbi:hypothetical protein [Tunicatimonas pelagia]|uniref:hypothetical protein n=1 Tax=Tunicatimonas pelagia TaxID=931531 RepID=UPI0026666857|nr:hypothetical protein [Tunicatimonas pelagia]WKN46160.1 hypothetical protein P0M28_14490 [Tunicatimonas pelagia]